MHVINLAKPIPKMQRLKNSVHRMSFEGTVRETANNKLHAFLRGVLTYFTTLARFNIVVNTSRLHQVDKQKTLLQTYFVRRKSCWSHFQQYDNRVSLRFWPQVTEQLTSVELHILTPVIISFRPRTLLEAAFYSWLRLPLSKGGIRFSEAPPRFTSRCCRCRLLRCWKLWASIFSVNRLWCSSLKRIDA